MLNILNRAQLVLETETCSRYEKTRTKRLCCKPQNEILAAVDVWEFIGLGTPSSSEWHWYHLAKKSDYGVVELSFVSRTKATQFLEQCACLSFIHPELKVSQAFSYQRLISCSKTLRWKVFGALFHLETDSGIASTFASNSCSCFSFLYTTVSVFVHIEYTRE